MIWVILFFQRTCRVTSNCLKASSHNDIAEGKLTLPIIYTIFNPDANEKDKRRLIKFLGNRKLKDNDKKKLLESFGESGAIEYAMQFVEYYSKLVTEEYVTYIHETPTRLKWIIKLMDITPLVNISFRKMAIENKWRKLEPKILTDELVNDINSITERENFWRARIDYSHIFNPKHQFWRRIRTGGSSLHPPPPARSVQLVR